MGLAVSGGPDSLALLLLAQVALPGRIAVATVDHGLRAESAVEAALVAQLCAALDVPHLTLPVKLEPGNLQSQARAARYAALGEWLVREDLAALATAHHADDQAETLLLRLGRASGVAGLAGVRARGLVPGTGLPLLRPLLGFRRSELGDVVAAAGWQAVDDPSNRDDRFDRARIRKAIAGADWL
ncbi:MAG: tRNA lysidine(34) synthetase TilS, partial [Novosphingobium sp.]|uniref:tRNA lysidine(34) synthetase TilS n=1 Tax=Novosphingobium sp. TaxID=1874826 RepID=UPI003C7E1B54